MNPRPLRPERSATQIQLPAKQQLTNGDTHACTTACTGKAEIGQNNTTEKVFAAEQAGWPGIAALDSGD